MPPPRVARIYAAARKAGGSSHAEENWIAAAEMAERVDNAAARNAHGAE